MNVSNIYDGGNDQLVCVPSGCSGEGSDEEECSETWQYQTDLCQQSVLSWPDTNFHYCQERDQSAPISWSRQKNHPEIQLNESLQS